MNYSALKSELLVYSTGTSDAAIVSDLTSKTSPKAVTRPIATSGGQVRGVLYPRGSWDRIISVMRGAFPNVSMKSQVICQNLVDMVNQNAPIDMTISAVANKINNDLQALEAEKLSDSKGILWASNELTVGDPGDAAILMKLLSQEVVSWADANGCTGLTVGDVQTARAQL